MLNSSASTSDDISIPPNWHSFVCRWYFGNDKTRAIDMEVKSLAEHFLSIDGERTEVIPCWTSNPNGLAFSKFSSIDNDQKPLLVLLMNKDFRNTLTPMALRGLIGHEVAHWRMKVRNECALSLNLSLKERTICEHYVDVKALDYVTDAEGLIWLKETHAYGLQRYTGIALSEHDKMLSLRIKLMENTIAQRH